MKARIIGTGSCLPKTVVTNYYLSTIMDTSDEWIQTRTGIRERRLALQETTTSMAVEAAKLSLQDAGISAKNLDMIIVATLSADHFTPSAACEVQAGISADQAICFDINAACSGFLYALQTVNAYFQSGLAKNALIIGVETLSKIMDWSDRSTCVLFGDGAGAAVLTADEETGLLALKLGSDGQKGDVLTCVNRKVNNPLVENEQTPEYIRMNGQEVYKFAVSKVPESIQETLGQAGLEADQIKYFLLHQANLRILQSVAKRLHVEEEKFPISLDHCGNISAASIPILLDEVHRKGYLQKKDKIVLSGFGGGLTWGSAVLEW